MRYSHIKTTYHNKVTDYSKYKTIPVPEHHVRGYKGGIKKRLHTFLTLVLDGMRSQHHIAAAIPPMESKPGTNCIKGWINHRASLDKKVVKESLPC
jgi:hypothetical protein